MTVTLLKGLRTSAIAAVVLGASSAAQADVRVLFREGAPTDRFEIRNTGGCPLGPMTLRLDLSESSGGLIFDTSASGPGVQVYQPFELVAGAELVRAFSDVRDGGRSVELLLTGLHARQEVAFTIDVDDTLVASPWGQTQVAGSEIKGAEVAIDFDEAGAGLPPVEARFDANAVALLPVSNCVS